MKINKIAQQVYQVIVAVCPVDGISIGDPENKSTWRIDFKSEATQQQRSAALSALAGFDPDNCWAERQASAAEALNASDRTMMRISEGVALGTTGWTDPDVVAWANYRRALRAIVTASAGDGAAPLPKRPSYPVGT